MMKNEREIVEYYNNVFGKNSSRYSRMMNDLIPTVGLTSDSNVLDYGCGTGLVSHYLHNKYHCSIDAVDLSQEELDGAKNTWKEDKIVWQNMSAFDFPSKKYDLIISSQVIEHVHNVGNYLNRINKMLKDGAKLLIGLPNICTPNYMWRQFRIKESALKGWSKNMLDNYDKGMDHINSWDSFHFTTLLASMGFELERFCPTEGVPKFRGGDTDEQNKSVN